MSALDFLRAPARQASAISQTAHRPWPLPSDPWTLAQSWEDLLFAHWRVDAEQLRKLVPPELELEEHDGSAWLGITPFVLTGFRLRGTFPLPRVSTFPELNVRTYVSADGKPGIWFFSLDASSEPAVLAARYGYKLPYHRAEMHAEWRGGWLSYGARRRGSNAPPAAFHGRYRPDGDRVEPDPRSLAHFLTERYCLYTVDGGRLKRGEIHHPPWPLQPARAEIDENSMPPPGIEPADEDPLLHFSARQDVLVWPLEDA
jgi:uncharacterized protein